MKTIRLCCLALALGSLIGCHSTREDVDDTLSHLRNEVHAQRAWSACKDDYCKLTHPGDFGKGFKAGYSDVMAGGPGCPPTIPPRRYMKVWNQNPTGQAKTVAWYNGYSQGVLSAQKQGVSEWSQVVTAPYSESAPVDSTPGRLLPLMEDVPPAPVAGDVSEVLELPMPDDSP